MTSLLQQAFDQAARLPPHEQDLLAARLLAELVSKPEATQPRRRFWREIRGSLPCGLLGEDAQVWVSRSRRESDEQRERPWKGNP